MIHLNSNTLHLQSYLEERHWLDGNELVTKVEKPGEGNMNFTLRVYTSLGRTFIVKQSRDFVEKYPSIAAPANRAIVEGRFFEFTQQNQEIGAFMPKLLGMDTENNVIVTEDLGVTRDLSYLYQPHALVSESDIEGIISFLNLLHSGFRNESLNSEFVNADMRVLNHEHIFVYPFMIENGFNLDQIQLGLQELAMTFKSDENLKAELQKLGEIYLQDGPYLLHGDYYFGSFLKTEKGIKVIDPEFCFYGFAEFDLGVFIAHLKMSLQSQEIIDLAFKIYKRADDFNLNLLNQFVGVEIMRRIIGLAQLPLSLDLETKKELLNEARGLIMNNII